MFTKVSISIAIEVIYILILSACGASSPTEEELAEEAISTREYVDEVIANEALSFLDCCRN